MERAFSPVTILLGPLSFPMSGEQGLVVTVIMVVIPFICASDQKIILFPALCENVTTHLGQKTREKKKTGGSRSIFTLLPPPTVLLRP